MTAGYIVAIGNLGAIIATWTYLPTDAPLYSRGHYINVGAECITFLLSILGIGYTLWENKERENGVRNARITGLSDVQIKQLGYKDPSFRYMS